MISQGKEKHTEAMQDSIIYESIPKVEEKLQNPLEQQKKEEKVSKAVKLNYWRPEEQQVYLEFLKEHMPMITSVAYRKAQRIFKKISMRLGTRSPIQVKSHHQKLEEKFKTIPRIISYVQDCLKAAGKDRNISECCSDESISTEQEPMIEGISVNDACLQVEMGHCIEIPHYQQRFFEQQFDQNYIRVPIFVEEESFFNF